MKYFLDTEFHEYKKQPKVLGIKIGKPIDTIELISIDIVSEDCECKTKQVAHDHYDLNGKCKTPSRDYYAICKDFNLKAAWNNEWLRENVLIPIMWEGWAKGVKFKNYSAGYAGIKLPKSEHFRLFKAVINKYGKSREAIAEEIKEFVYSNNIPTSFEKSLQQVYKNKHEDIEFYAYYADYDWALFYSLWSELYPTNPKEGLTGMSYTNPKGFPYYCKDLKPMLDDKGNPDHSSITQDNEHNALADAKWNKRLYKFISEL